jgi:RNA polymerase sigma-70 factor (ECF subfamily)
VSIWAKGDRQLSPNDVRDLYDRHSRGLLAYACSILSSFAAAEDVLHEVFERLLRSNTEITSSPKTYLYRAVRNASLNAKRNRKHDVRLDDVWLEGPAGTGSDVIDLQLALRELPQEQREIIILHLWGGLTFDDLATALGIPRDTAASRYRYGLSRLREQLQTVEKG